MQDLIRKILPLVLLIAASLLVPANQGQIIAAVVFLWVLGWALSNRNDPGQMFAFLTSVALVILGVASIIQMGMWQLNLWQGYLPTAMAAGISFIVSMTVNKK